MAGNVSLNTVTDGLVLYLDASNTKSLADVPSQNLVTWSQDLGALDWITTTGITVPVNKTISPSGIQNADTLTTLNPFPAIRESITVSANTVYTFSFYVLRGTMTDLKYSIYNFTSPSNIISPTSYYSQTSSTTWKSSCCAG
jgi:hypothetical protein